MVFLYIPVDIRVARWHLQGSQKVRNFAPEMYLHPTYRRGKGGFTEEQAALAVTQIVIRATHPASELATAKWIRNNSDICRLTGYDMDKVTACQGIPQG